MNRCAFWLGVVLFIAAPCWPDDQKDINALTIEQLLQVRVEAAALHPQTLEDAPASVSIITAADIRKYGYRTLAEALSSARGFYASNNRTYTTMGVRGFSLPGDYASHLLVMVNGHNMNDNVFDYMLFFGNDFPIDMNLIKQIEIIRGPSSALYGSNGMFATINIVTKTPDEVEPLTVTADTGSFSEKRGQVTAARSFGGAKVLVSGTVFNNTGESPLFFPQYNTPQTNYGNAIDMNGERGYHFFSTVVWRNWSVTAAFAGHDRIQPVSWGQTIFNDRGTQNADTRDFIDAVYSRQIGGGTLRWRTYYDSYHYAGRFEYSLGTSAGVEDNRQNVLGNWVGSQLTYRFRPTRAGEFTVGMEASADIRNLQMDADVSPAPLLYLSTSNRDRSVAVIVQDEKELSRHWKLDLGLRVDKSTYRYDFASPRAALIYQRAEWTYKFLYGRSFRNPSAFQLFNDDGLSSAANPALRPESADTVEFDVERKLGSRMNLIASAYGYRMHDVMLGVFLPDGLLQYQNEGTIKAEGVELEFNGRPWGWLEATGSYALQRSGDPDGEGVMENSPLHLAKLRFSIPVGRHLDASSGMQFYSSRRSVGDVRVKPVYVADFTLTSKNLFRNLDFRVGIRNAFNRNYADPVSLNSAVVSMVQPGRSVFVELIAHGRR